MTNIEIVLSLIASKVRPVRETIRKELHKVIDADINPEPLMDSYLSLLSLLDQQTRLLRWCGHRWACLDNRTEYEEGGLDPELLGCTCGLTDELKAITKELKSG